uniref:GLOBIN domain-containing protein n=1 Tax=Macrostomum lignano TaxID=282301 RepID=A0A1I8F8G1_9PLAT
DLNKALRRRFKASRRLGAAYTDNKAGLDEATGRRHSRSFSAACKSRAELEKMPKMRAHALRVVNTLDGAIQSLDDTWRCAPALWELIGASHKSHHLSAKHFTRPLNAALAVVFERRLAQEPSLFLLLVQLLTDLSEAATSACPPGFSKNLSSTVCTFIRQEPQVTFCEANRQCALLGAELVTDSGAISALASFTAAPSGLAPPTSPTRRDTDRRPTGGSSTARQSGGGEQRLAQREAQQSGRQPRLPAGQGRRRTGRCGLHGCGWHCASPDPSARVGAGCQRLQAAKAVWRPARSRASTKMRKPSLVRFCTNRRTSDCRLLLFTDSEVEEAVETSADWQKVCLRDCALSGSAGVRDGPLARWAARQPCSQPQPERLYGGRISGATALLDDWNEIDLMTILLLRDSNC